LGLPPGHFLLANLASDRPDFRFDRPCVFHAKYDNPDYLIALGRFYITPLFGSAVQKSGGFQEAFRMFGAENAGQCCVGLGIQASAVPEGGPLDAGAFQNQGIEVVLKRRELRAKQASRLFVGVACILFVAVGFIGRTNG